MINYIIDFFTLKNILLIFLGIIFIYLFIKQSDKNKENFDDNNNNNINNIGKISGEILTNDNIIIPNSIKIEGNINILNGGDTNIMPRGSMILYDRAEPLPEGWIVDESFNPIKAPPYFVYYYITKV